MKLARRVASLSPSLTLAISSKAKAMKAAGEDVCGFGAGEPDFDTPEPVRRAAIEALNEGFTRYTPATGIPELRAAICERMRRDIGVEYDPSQVVVSCGAKHSVFNVVMALCDPGDEVLIPAPYWLSYPEMVRAAEGVPVTIPASPGNGFRVAAEQIDAACGPSTRLLILNTPSNPTGAVYGRGEIEEIAEVCRKRDIAVLSDEIYDHLLYDGAEHVSIASMPGMRDRVIVVNGASKSYSMTGWRIGWAAGPADLMKAIASLQSHSTSNPTSFAQKGALAALEGDQTVVDEMRRAFAERRGIMYEGLIRLPGVRCVKPMGAFYMFPDISATGMDSVAFAEAILEREKVALVPGRAFGEDRCVRLSYACSPETIEKGLERMARFLKATGPV